MSLKYDHYGRREPEIIYLATPDRKILCALNGVDESSVSLEHHGNNADYLTFQLDRLVDGELSNYYEYVEEGMLLYCDDVWFLINRPPETYNDAIREYKTIEAESYEIMLQQYDLENFLINTGTAGSYEMQYRDKMGGQTFYQVTFHNEAIPELSLVDIMLKHADVPYWKIGYIDDRLSEDYGLALEAEVYTFEEDSKDLYSFITQTLAQTFKCIPVFDTKNLTISFYRIESIGEDTNICIGFQNVQNNVTISRDNQLTTCYTVYGGDELRIDYVNFDNNVIYDISYFMQPPYMTSYLIEKYQAYLDYRETQRPTYMELSKEYNNYLYVVSDLLYRVPDDAVLNDWTESDVDSLQNAYNNYTQIIISLESLYVDDNGDFDLEALKESSDWNTYESIMNYTLPKIVAALQSKETKPELEEGTSPSHPTDYGSGNILGNVNPVVIDDTWESVGAPITANTFEVTDSPAYGIVRGMHIESSGGGTYGYSQKQIHVNDGSTYVLSAFVRRISDVETINLEYGVSNTERESSTFLVPGEGWQRIYKSFMAESSMIEVAFTATASGSNSAFEICGMQLELGDAPTQFGYYIQDENVLEAFETDWKLYGVEELQIKLKTYEQQIKSLEDSGISESDWGDYLDIDEDYYNRMRQMYLDYKRLYDECEKALEERQAEYDEANAHLEDLNKQRQKIADDVLLENFGLVQSEFLGFTEEEINLIKSFYIHKDYTNENIIATSLDTEADIVDIQYKLYQDAMDILYTESHPQYTYEDDIENVYALSDYADTFIPEMNLWNYLYIALSDVRFVKLRLMSIKYNPCVWNSEITVTFSNMIQYKSKRNDFVTILDNLEGSTKNRGGTIGSPTSVDTFTVTADVVKQLLRYPGFGSSIVSGSMGAISGQINYLVVKTLQSEKVITNVIDAVEGNFNKIFTDYIQSDIGDFNKIVTDFLMAGDIITDDISAATGNFTNYLTGVKILGDIIEANTIVADKLIIRGYDANGNLGNSVIYALNNEGNFEATGIPPEEVENYQLSGKILVAESVTANKINVQDLWVNGVANLLNANIGNAWIDDLTALTSDIGNWHIEGSVISSNSYESKIIGGLLESANYKVDADGNCTSGCQIDLINFVWNSPNFKIKKNGDIEIKGTLSVGSVVPVSSVVNEKGESLEDILNTMGGTIELHSDDMAFIEENAIITPDMITVNAVAKSCTVEHWYVNGEENTTMVAQDKLSISIPSAYMIDRTSILIEATNGDGSISDVFTIYKLKDGDSAITVMLQSSHGYIFQETDTTITNTEITATVYRGTIAIYPESYEWYIRPDDSAEWVKQSETSSTFTMPLNLFQSRMRVKCCVDV